MASKEGQRVQIASYNAQKSHIHPKSHCRPTFFSGFVHFISPRLVENVLECFWMSKINIVDVSVIT